MEIEKKYIFLKKKKTVFFSFSFGNLLKILKGSLRKKSTKQFRFGGGDAESRQLIYPKSAPVHLYNAHSFLQVLFICLSCFRFWN